MSTRNSKFTSLPSNTSSPSRRNGKAPRKSAPVAKSLRRTVSRPPVVASSGGSTTVRHREFVSDVTGQTAFAPRSFPINPGRDTLFTWLPSIAMRFERYQFRSLKFVYEPRCSTITNGTVILAVDYDPTDNAPANKQDAYAYHHSAQSVAWDECVLSVESGILANRGTLFCRNKVVAGTDLKTYDLGNLWLCVSGFAAATVCGELFVEYEVQLSIPQVENDVQFGTLPEFLNLNANHLFGTSQLHPQGNLDATVGDTGNVLVFDQNFTGACLCRVIGTGLSFGSYLQSGNALTQLQWAILDDDATHLVFLFNIFALNGQNLLPQIGATTVTGAEWRFYPTA